MAGRKARDGFRVAVPLYSVGGRISHLQLRSLLAGVKGSDSKRSTPGSYPPGGLAMGCVKEATTAPRVYLTGEPRAATACAAALGKREARPPLLTANPARNAR